MSHWRREERREGRRDERQSERLHDRAVDAAVHGDIGRAAALEVSLECTTLRLHTYLTCIISLCSIAPT